MTKIVDYKNVEIHRKELVVLKNVSFALEEGEFVYLIGRVGSGKSSLLKSLYAEIPIASGDAHILDYDLMNIKKKHIPLLRRNLGIVFQDFQLLTDRTVYENLEFVLRATGWKDANEIDERIDQTLHQVGMANKSYKMPHELSGGEQQRVVIARALLNNPKMILADEPTGNLDPETGHQIIRLRRSSAESGTEVSMATHNIELVKEFPCRTVKCEDKALTEIEI